MSRIPYLVLLSFIAADHIDCQSVRLDIDFLLYTRKSVNYQSIRIGDNKTLESSYYDGSLKTVLIINGYLDNIKFTPWPKRLTEELLRNSDCNVILVDWSKLNHYFYSEVVYNVPRVGEEVSELIKFLQNSTGTYPQLFHIIGHSLGAHVAGFVGKNTPNLGRITGLDPAGPNFQNVDSSQRLDKTDAKFVDVIHTDAANDVAVGLGSGELIGHVDFFPNGGYGQPGCIKSILLSFLKDGIITGISRLLGCDHTRVIDLFIYSINNKHCLPVGIRCKSWKAFRRGGCGDCERDGSRCARLGFHAGDNEAALNKTESGDPFFLKTPGDPPYCYHQYQIKMGLAQPNNASIGISGLYLVLYGNIESKRVTLIEGFNTLNSSKTYSYLITSEHELGTIVEVGFRWVDDSHYDYPPYIFRNSTVSTQLYLKKIRIAPITLGQSFRYFCGDPQKPLLSNQMVLLSASKPCQSN